MPERIATLSFDDGGWQDVETIRVLRRHGFRATFYLCGGDRWHTEHYYHVPEKAIPALYDGMEVGCHGMEHRPMEQLHPSKWHEEIGMARDYLLRRFAGTGQAVECYAWPRNSWQHGMEKTCRESGFLWARTYSPSPDPWYVASGARDEPGRWLGPPYLTTVNARMMPDWFGRIDDMTAAGLPIHVAGHPYQVFVHPYFPDVMGRETEGFARTLEALARNRYEVVPNSEFWRRVRPAGERPGGKP